MAVIVQKYGGTSVGSLSRIETVAEGIIETVRKGHQVVVVLSAMSGETNRLLSLAQQLDPNPASRELDMLLASGEQVSISLLAIALVKRGISAISLLANQIGIKTDNKFGAARIEKIETQRLSQALAQEQVVIVAGFQGQDRDNNITTLGRGGSDVSAVALAVALSAAEVQIFTDVDGVYSADPRIIEKAQRIPYLSFEEMLVMASLGAKVLQNRAVEYAYRHNMPIRVLSSFESGEGTKVIPEQQVLAETKNQALISSVVHQQQQSLVEVADISEAAIAALFNLFEQESIEVDLVSINEATNGNKLLKFATSREKINNINSLFEQITNNFSSVNIRILDSVAKVSVVGIGINSHAGVVSKMLSVLVSENIDIMLISTSEISCSVVIDESKLVLAIRILHSKFGLDLSL